MTEWKIMCSTLARISELSRIGWIFQNNDGWLKLIPPNRGITYEYNDFKELSEFISTIK